MIATLAGTWPLTWQIIGFKCALDVQILLSHAPVNRCALLASNILGLECPGYQRWRPRIIGAAAVCERPTVGVKAL
jgi:hypothetical protein